MKGLAIILVGGAAKIAADVIFGRLSLCAHIQGRRAAPKKYVFICDSALIEAPSQDEASGLLLPCSGAVGAIQ